MRAWRDLNPRPPTWEAGALSRLSHNSRSTSHVEQDLVIRTKLRTQKTQHNTKVHAPTRKHKRRMDSRRNNRQRIGQTANSSRLHIPINNTRRNNAIQKDETSAHSLASMKIEVFSTNLKIKSKNTKFEGRHNWIYK